MERLNGGVTLESKKEPPEQHINHPPSATPRMRRDLLIIFSKKKRICTTICKLSLYFVNKIFFSS